MPTYAYRCKDCFHAFDAVQAFTDPALTVCPECGGNLRKQFNSVGVVFKGSGFYRNDSRADSKASSSLASTSPAKSTTEKTSSTASSTTSTTTATSGGSSSSTSTSTGSTSGSSSAA